MTHAAGRAEVLSQGADEKRKEKRETRLVDVAEEVLRKDRKNLEGLVRIGWPNVQREDFKGKVKQKVWEMVSGGFDTTDIDMVEEVTERIIDVSEADPYYRAMFEDKEPKG
jgi:hypothetical protein